MFDFTGLEMVERHIQRRSNVASIYWLFTGRIPSKKSTLDDFGPPVRVTCFRTNLTIPLPSYHRGIWPTVGVGFSSRSQLAIIGCFGTGTQLLGEICSTAFVLCWLRFGWYLFRNAVEWCGSRTSFVPVWTFIWNQTSTDETNQNRWNIFHRACFDHHFHFLDGYAIPPSCFLSLESGGDFVIDIRDVSQLTAPSQCRSYCIYVLTSNLCLLFIDALYRDNRLYLGND